MRMKEWIVVVALTLAVGVNSARADDTKKSDDGCGNHGTAVEFLDTPSEAARKALKEEKLVFVLHVSGNFEDPRFT